MTTATDFALNEVRRNLRELAADLRGRAEELADFEKRVGEQATMTPDGAALLLDPRGAFMSNLLRALDDATRTSRQEQARSAAIRNLSEAHAYLLKEATE